MRIESLKQLYEIILKKMPSYKIVLNESNLIIENSANHFIKIVFNHGFFDVYIDNFHYYDVDTWDIEDSIESIMTEEYILFKNNTVYTLSQKQYEKVIKKDKKACIIKFNND